MSKQASGSFVITTWNEAPVPEWEGEQKLTRAAVQQAYTGGYEGTGMLEYLMTYRPDQSASFVGYERVTGTLDGRSGTFILQHSGTYEQGVARSSFLIVAASGTGDLAGISGEGSYVASHDSVSCTLSYTLG